MSAGVSRKNEEASRGGEQELSDNLSAETQKMVADMVAAIAKNTAVFPQFEGKDPEFIAQALHVGLLRAAQSVTLESIIDFVTNSRQDFYSKRKINKQTR